MSHLTGAMSSAKEEFYNVARMAQGYFEQDIGDGLLRVMPDDWKILIWATSERIDSLLKRRDNPISVEEFLASISLVFDTSYICSLKAKFEAFDKMAGAPLSNVFIQQKIYPEWTHDLVESIITYCHSHTSQAETVSETLASLTSISPTSTSPSSASPSVMIRTQSGLALQLDGAGDDITNIKELKQINLQGGTILDAWKSNMEARNLGFPTFFPKNWSPATPGAFDVFHGTSAHLDNSVFREALSISPFPGLELSAGVNQMVPAQIPCIYTSFSAVRSFLWAAFLAEVITDPPQPAVLNRLNREWTSEGKTYRGVVLFQFRSTQPAPSGLSYHVIELSKEDAWYQAAKELDFWAPTDAEKRLKAWGSKSFKNLHNSSEKEWPDVVHGLEINETKTVLRPFVRDMFWRTTWCFLSGQNELNKQHEATYAISFELESPELETVKEDDDNDTEKKGKKDGSGKKDEEGKRTFGKGTLRRLKTKFKRR